MNIVVLTTYPTSDPQHGGQHRAFNIIEQLRLAGHRVTSAGVLGSPSYAATAGFLDFPGHKELSKILPDCWLMEDWAISRLMFADDEYFDRLRNKISDDTDLIFCEQPWLVAFAQRYREVMGKPGEIRLVYGSANVESLLKKSIMESYRPPEYAQYCHDLVLDCEVEALNRADLVAAVSKEDRSWASGRTRVPVILAPNGVADRPATVQEVAQSNKITGHRKFALYCASAHPPNIKGFYDIFPSSLGCFPAEERLVIAGSAGSSITADPRFGNLVRLPDVWIDAGLVSEQQLAGLLATAHTFILPITEGQGTNLKTAEALRAGKHVVATSKAMRGFEAFCDAPGVIVADTAQAFAEGVRAAMSSPPLQLSVQEMKRRDTLLWKHSLADLVGAVDAWETRLG